MVADKSWGTPAPAGLRIRTNDTPRERATERAAAREARALEAAKAVADRLDARAVARQGETAARERARVERREAELLAARKSAARDPHAAAASRHRSSGRKDVVREQRDTRGYATVVDVARIRELAKRGASIAGLAGAFGVSEAEVTAVLAE